MAIKCFNKSKLTKLKKIYQSRVKEGMSDVELRDIGTQVAVEYYNKLSRDIAALRNKLGANVTAENVAFSETKFSDRTVTRSDNRSLKVIFDEFTGPAENRKYNTQKEFRTTMDYFNAVKQILSTDTLDGSIVNTLSIDIRDKYLEQNPNFVDQVKSRIEKKMTREYDPGKNSLFGWMFGKNKAGKSIVQLAAGDIIKQKEVSTVSTERRIGSDDSKRTVGDTIASNEISIEDAIDMEMARERTEKLKKATGSSVVNKLKLTDDQVNLGKRAVQNFLRKPRRPEMTNPKRFFQELVEYVVGPPNFIQGYATTIYDSFGAGTTGKLSTANRVNFIENVAEDIIKINKVDPAMIRRARWKIFYEEVEKNVGPVRTQQLIDQGVLPANTLITSGPSVFKDLNPTKEEVVQYLMKIRTDALKRKFATFFAEVIVKNEFNDVLNNEVQPLYNMDGKVVDKEGFVLSDYVNVQEKTEGQNQVNDYIRRPDGIRLSQQQMTNGLMGFEDLAGALRFSIKNRQEYINRLKKKRPNMQNPEDQVDAIFDYVDQLGINPNKRKKWENIALKYTYSSDINMLLDGDRQKISQVYELSQKNKFDPMAFKSPEEVIAMYSKKLTSKQVDASKYDMLTNREELTEGIETYNLDGSRKGHKQLRDIVDKCWGKAYQNWCITRNIETKVEADAEAAAMADMGFEMMDGLNTELKIEEKVSPLEKSYQDAYLNYNDNGKAKVVFKNKVLLGFIDKRGEFWNKMNAGSNNIQITEKEGNKRNIFNIVDNKKELFQTEEGERGGTGTYKLFNAKGKLVVEEKYKNNENVYKKSDDFLGITIYEKKETPTTTTIINYNGPMTGVDGKIEKVDGISFRRDTEVINKKTGETVKTTENDLSKTVTKSKNNTLVESITEYKSKDRVYAGPNEANLFRFGNTDNHVKKTTTTMNDQGKNMVIETVKDKVELQFNKIGRVAEEKINGEVVTRELRFSKKVKPETKVDPNLEQINRDFNNIIEQSKGIPASKVIYQADAANKGRKIGRFKFFIPPSAEDFLGLIYPLLGKGKVGEAHLKFFEDKLIIPYTKAKNNFTNYKLQMMELVKKATDTLKEQGIPKVLSGKAINDYTNEQAVRVYLYDKAGHVLPNIDEKQVEDLVEYVKMDPALKEFADRVFDIGKDYPKPLNNWNNYTIAQDYVNVLENKERAKFLEETGFTENVDTIFSESNKNKLRSVLGNNYVDALENIIARMKTGNNRTMSSDFLGDRFLNYLNGSIGAIMFFNTRSAFLQLLSTINFVNWSFNNPYKAAKAVSNFSQLYADVKYLFNSSFLEDRRKGLKVNINEAELAAAAKKGNNPFQVFTDRLLKAGFSLTQAADSTAIAVGGATFYRNRINDLVKNQGMDVKAAEEQAYLEFQEQAERAQQSSDPSKISMEQASTVLGRLILAFANTPMQYARLTKRAMQDLVNGRGDAKTNASKIAYYLFIQNLMFNMLQLAVNPFGDEEEQEYLGKNTNMDIIDSWINGTLRGMGVYGNVAAMSIKVFNNLQERSEKPRPDYGDEVITMLKASPPVGSKVQKIQTGLNQFGYGQEIEGLASITEGVTNLPTKRVFDKIDHIADAISGDYSAWHRILMFAGWPAWQIEGTKARSRKKSRNRFRGGSFKRKFKR